MRVVCGLQMRDAGLAHQEGPPDVYTLDQIVTLYFRLFRSRDIDRAGIVDQHIQLPEMSDRLRYHFPDLVLEPDITMQGQDFAVPGCGNLLCGGIDRSFQLWIGFSGLADDGDIGALRRKADRNSLADPAGAARYEHGLVFKALHGPL